MQAEETPPDSATTEPSEPIAADDYPNADPYYTEYYHHLGTLSYAFPLPELTSPLP
jgi:hypothetical protein